MYSLPLLNFGLSDLEPFIDSETVNVHYNKHHKTYLDKLNEALAKYESLSNKDIESVLSDLDSVPEEIRTIVRNMGGGFYNHNVYWETLAPANSKPISENFRKELESQFGTFDEFKTKLTDVSIKQFGSGWGWLVLDQSKKLIVLNTSNQDCPISKGSYPIMTIDVWEHAYYLKYQNRRNEYVQNIWNLINWEAVEKRYELGLSL